MLRIVFVCTGNRCRSPVAEAATRSLAGTLPVETESFGLVDTRGAHPPIEVQEAAGELGINVNAHRARLLTSKSLSSHDLVLGFEWRHVAALVVDEHIAPERAFTLPEIVELLRLSEPIDDSEVGDLSIRANLAITRAHELRSARLRDHIAQGVPDPLGKPRRVHRRTASSIYELCVGLLDGLFGSETTVPSRDEAAAKSERIFDSTLKPVGQLEW